MAETRGLPDLPCTNVRTGTAVHIDLAVLLRAYKNAAVCKCLFFTFASSQMFGLQEESKIYVCGPKLLHRVKISSVVFPARLLNLCEIKGVEASSTEGLGLHTPWWPFCVVTTQNHAWLVRGPSQNRPIGGPYIFVFGQK